METNILQTLRSPTITVANMFTLMISSSFCVEEEYIRNTFSYRMKRHLFRDTKECSIYYICAKQKRFLIAKLLKFMMFTTISWFCEGIKNGVERSGHFCFKRKSHFSTHKKKQQNLPFRVLLLRTLFLQLVLRSFFWIIF